LIIKTKYIEPFQKVPLVLFFFEKNKTKGVRQLGWSRALDQESGASCFFRYKKNSFCIFAKRVFLIYLLNIKPWEKQKAPVMTESAATNQPA
jgi:hypothetical protein